MKSERINNVLHPPEITEDLIHFYWNRKKYFARKGDSIAAGLLANNLNIIGRSFKYHRPRGVMSAGVEEA